ncbi:MAG TPA: hypothetical protein VMT03_17440 [Polyangia bacterium]|nr:hypothetical protein [Polyangia bacterium]
MNAATNQELFDNVPPQGNQDAWLEGIETGAGIALADDDSVEITQVFRTPIVEPGTISSRLGLCLLAVVAIGGMLAAAFAGTLTTF